MGCPLSASRTEHGDLYATVDVQLPRELTPEQRTHFEALQKLQNGYEELCRITPDPKGLAYDVGRALERPPCVR